MACTGMCYSSVLPMDGMSRRYPWQTCPSWYDRDAHCKQLGACCGIYIALCGLYCLTCILRLEDALVWVATPVRGGLSQKKLPFGAEAHLKGLQPRQKHFLEQTQMCVVTAPLSDPCPMLPALGCVRQLNGLECIQESIIRCSDSASCQVYQNMAPPTALSVLSGSLHSMHYPLCG